MHDDVDGAIVRAASHAKQTEGFVLEPTNEKLTGRMHRERVDGVRVVMRKDTLEDVALDAVRNAPIMNLGWAVGAYDQDVVAVRERHADHGADEVLRENMMHFARCRVIDGDGGDGDGGLLIRRHRVRAREPLAIGGAHDDGELVLGGERDGVELYALLGRPLRFHRDLDRSCRERLEHDNHLRVGARHRTKHVSGEFEGGDVAEHFCLML